MRLTLRTLLAYLDDVLAAPQRQEIARKVDRSEAARELVAHIRLLDGARGEITPPDGGPGEPFDANTVGDYLDNLLTPDEVAAIEKLCLESDVHLDEITACHQILRMVLEKPLSVRPGVMERMYALAHAPQKVTEPLAAPADSNGRHAPEPVADPPPPVANPPPPVADTSPPVAAPPPPARPEAPRPKWIEFTCSCGEQLSVEDDPTAWKDTACPSCGSAIAPPTDSDAEPAGKPAPTSPPAPRLPAPGPKRPDRRKAALLAAIVLVVLAAGWGVVYLVGDVGNTRQGDSMEGSLEKVDRNGISGWAWDSKRPDSPIVVLIFDGDTVLTSQPANEFRQDLLDAGKGNGKHGFLVPLPQTFRDRRPHTVRVRFGGSSRELDNSPKTFTYSP